MRVWVVTVLPSSLTCVLYWLACTLIRKGSSLPMTNMAITKCAVDYCLYNEKNNCTLINPPMINEFGMCSECTMITLDYEFLESEKDRQLSELESR